MDVRSAVPTFEQIRSQVTRLVLTGVLPAGTRLPPIRQLAGHLGLSNGVVARAYRELEREGTVLTAGKRGTIVTELDPGQPADTATRERERAGALAAAATQYAAIAHSLGYGPTDCLAALSAVLPDPAAPDVVAAGAPRSPTTHSTQDSAR